MYSSTIFNSTECVVNDNSEKNDEFDFKFISRYDFNSIYKSVLRRRREELEKKKWDIFIKKKAEEESKKLKITGSKVDSGVQCTNDRMQLNGCKTLRNDKFNSMPLNSNSVYNENVEINRNEFHQQSPSAKHEHSTGIIPNEFVDKYRTFYTEHDQHKIPHSETLAPTIEDKTYDVTENLNLEFLSLESDLSKVHSLREKMFSTLENIDKLIKQGPDYSDAEEIGRIKQRSNEFSHRFKRNYLYRMQCSVSEVDKILNDKQKLLVSKENLVLKFVSGHQTGLLTLQIIEKHLPKITINSPFSILNEFFNYICDLSKKFKSAFGGKSKDIEDDVVKICEQVMNTMIDLMKVKPRPQKAEKDKKKVKDRLWMYSSKNSWLNKTQARKSSATSKYQNIQQKKISPSQNIQQKIEDKSDLIRDELIEMNKKSKLNFRKRDAVAEDEIKTMVEMTEWDESCNSDGNEEQDSNLIGGYQMIQIDSEESAIQLGTVPVQPPADVSHVKVNVPNKHEQAERNKLKSNNVALIHVQSSSRERDSSLDVM